MSEGPVEAGGEDGDGAAVAVEGGVVHEFVVEGEMNGLPDWEVVVGLKDLLPAVSKGTVAGEDAGTAGSKKLLVDFRDAVEDAGKANCVVGAMPGLRTRL
jgi:hypothetical protein